MDPPTENPPITLSEHAPPPAETIRQTDSNNSPPSPLSPLRPNMVASKSLSPPAEETEPSDYDDKDRHEPHRIVDTPPSTDSSAPCGNPEETEEVDVSESPEAFIESSVVEAPSPPPEGGEPNGSGNGMMRLRVYGSEEDLFLSNTPSAACCNPFEVDAVRAAKRASSKNMLADPVDRRASVSSAAMSSYREDPFNTYDDRRKSCLTADTRRSGGGHGECSPLLIDAGSLVGVPPAGRGGALANLLNCILDAGLVGVPYALGQSGLVLGTCMVIATGLLTCYGLELLIHIADPAARHGAISCVAYEEVAELAGGKRMRMLVVLVQFLYCFGALVGYVFVVKDSLATAIKALLGGSKGDIVSDNVDELLYAGGVALIVIFPLCCLRSVADLGHVSAVTVGIVVMLIAIFSGNLAMEGFQGDPNDKYSYYGRSSFFDVVGTCIFAFMCHHNEFSIYRSLGSDATPQNFKPVLRGAVAISVVMSLAIGIVAFFSFGNSLNSDIFKNYTSSAPAIQVAKLGMVVNMLLSFPMNFGVAREMLQVLLSQAQAPEEIRIRHSQARSSISMFSGRERLSRTRNTDRLSRNTNNNNNNNRDTMLTSLSFDPEGRPNTMVWSELDRPPRFASEAAAGGGVRDRTSTKFHMITTLPLFGAAVGAGLALTDLGATLDLVGGLLGSLLGFVFPAVMALSLEDEPYGGRAACYALLAVGVVAGVAGTTSAIMAFIDGE